MCVSHLYLLLHILFAHFFVPAIAVTASFSLSWPCLKCMEHLLLFAVLLLCHDHMGCPLKPPPPAVLAQAQTGECEEVGTYWSNLLPLKSRASESTISSLYHIILTILRHNSLSSQRTLGRIKPQVPTGLASSVMRPGIAFLSFHLPFFSGPPFLSPGITSQSKPTASKSLSQTLPFEGTHN